MRCVRSFAPTALGLILLLIGGWQAPSEDPLKEGLTLWQKPDAQGRACASCHSPDGIELATFAYNAATIRRRAHPHLGKDAEKLSAYFVALRKQLGRSTYLDPMVARPMQPGDTVLPGLTAEERDNAFVLSLKAYLPTLSGPPVTNLKHARSALAEVLALDPASLRIGIPFNRLSEDRFHGNEHASLAHWIPDQPPLPYTQALRDAQSRYLYDPSSANFNGLRAIYDRYWNRSLQPSEAIALAKARSLLVYQHYLRTRTYAPLIPLTPNGAPPNPMWEIGDLARIYTNTEAGSLMLPADVTASKSGGPSLSAQMRDMRLPWLWLGWIMDPGLQRTSYDPRSRFGDWFAALLLEDGPYPAHAALMLTKKLATEGYVNEAWNSSKPQHLSVNFSWLLRDDNWSKYATKPSVPRKAYLRFLANAFRMFALLQVEEIGRTGLTYLREPLIQQFEYMQAAVSAMAPGRKAEDAPLFGATIKAIREAKLVPR